MNTSRGNGEPLSDLESTLVEMEQGPKVEKIERKFSRRSQVVVIVSLLVALGSTIWNGINAVQIAQNEASNTVQETDIEKLREANRLREQAGLPQIPIPPPGEDVDLEAFAAAAATLVLEDIQGDPRFRGRQGVPGESGQPGRVGDTGQRGQAGQDGSEGQDGRDGRSVDALSIDSEGNLWVFFDDPNWPPMMVGHVVGPTGPKGDPGAEGPMGPAGPQGEVGPMCLDSTPEERTIMTVDNVIERVLVCVINEGE